MITAIVMLFFLRSWRNSIVVLIAIPASLCVTLAAMKVVNFTIDTVSLLAMTLIIGILVDDSIVVLENVERHYDNGEAPREAAIKGPHADRSRGRRDHARRRGRLSADRVSAGYRREVSLRVCAGRRRRDADLALYLVYDYAGAGRQLVAALELESAEAHRAFRRRLREVASVVFAARASVGAAASGGDRRRLRASRSCFRSCSFRWAPSASSSCRRSIAGRFSCSDLSDRHAADDRQCRDRGRWPRVSKSCPTSTSQTALAGGTQSNFGGLLVQGSVGQIHVFLKPDRKQSDELLGAGARAHRGRSGARRRGSSRFPRPARAAATLSRSTIS